MKRIYWTMKRFLRRLVCLCAIAVIGNFWCNSRLQQEQWQIASRRIPEAFDGFRITLLTDIHGKSFGKNSQKLLQAVADAEPDLIAISGDLLDRYSSDEVLEPLLTGLEQIAPTYYVTGNHEWDRDDIEQLISQVEACGVTALRNSWLELTRDGQRIILAGAEDPNGYADQMQPNELVEQIRQFTADDPYILMLYHRNNSLDLWAGLDVDLVLAGHGHGGVLRLPFIGGLVGVDRRLFPKDCEGVYTQGRTNLAVSRGLAGVRVWNRPHIPTIVLESVNNS